MPNWLSPDELRSQLREALISAMKQRQPAAMSALRSAIAAIDNAEAVDLAAVWNPTNGPIAGAVSGLGAAEAPRRELSASDLAAIIQTEISERLQAAGDYERLGHHEQASRLREEAAVLRPFAAR